VAITETWISQGQEWLLDDPGFRCFKRNREGDKRDGGGVEVPFLIRDSITAAEREVVVEERLSTESKVKNRK